MVNYLDSDLYPETAPKKRKYNYEYRQEQFQKKQNLPDEAAFEAARVDALRLLDQRAYSRKRLFQKLKEKGYREEILQELLDTLEQAQLLDDYSYGLALVEYAFTVKGLYGKALQYELINKGIASEYIGELCKEITYSQAQEKAQELAQQKIGSLVGLEPEKQRNRLLSFLARKGYPYSLAETIVRNLLDE